MEVETVRILLSTMITAIPTVMSLCMVALFAFPRSKENWIRKNHIKLYLGLMSIFVLLVALAIIAVILDLDLLIKIDMIFSTGNPFSMVDSLAFSTAILIAFPMFLLFFLGIQIYIERNR